MTELLCLVTVVSFPVACLGCAAHITFVRRSACRLGYQFTKDVGYALFGIAEAGTRSWKRRKKKSKTKEEVSEHRLEEEGEAAEKSKANKISRKVSPPRDT